ncbi:putative alpha/beta superfamily hydrolase [Planomicrobium soli]|uniref:Putative alpha/beta superfamily hydrolase n=1 Tax=Planomicrobium soli TaxID=1176648 RepID=A0A2P8H1S6_9BACL|nr:alpha/beta hydrolase-fold protein [Planomicrobium soli]PSL40162.1 putative alpha/beta superfamily hydrolase [Planomicrobium soli]
MIESFSLRIDSLEDERLIRIYLPESYKNSAERYPVLYMHDGQNVFRDETAIDGVSLNLERYLEEKALRVIVVAVNQNSTERKNEYCPWPNGEYSTKFLADPTVSFGGKGKQYIEFIVNQLKPYIDKTYRTMEDQTAMAGISMGGLISAYAALQYPNVFKDIAILSSAFYANQEEMEKLAENADLSKMNRIYMDCGTDEAGEGTLISKRFLLSNKAFYEKIKGKVPNSHFVTIKNGQH